MSFSAFSPFISAGLGNLLQTIPAQFSVKSLFQNCVYRIRNHKELRRTESESGSHLLRMAWI